MKNEDVLSLVSKIGGDGWTIFNADSELFNNLTDRIRERATKTYKSDGSPKGTIWGDDGNMIKEMSGIYALDLMYLLAREVGADTKKADLMGGRGFASRALADAIKKKLGMEEA